MGECIELLVAFVAPFGGHKRMGFQDLFVLVLLGPSKEQWHLQE